ncbi:MAG: hypothetical protein KA207_18660 [Burkholderiaceae bacterium]|nr:hypothetical protein [Burkholderiaceae bacterium]
MSLDCSAPAKRSARAARVFTWLTAIAVLFQWALAAGLPWGELAWGGAYPGVLPEAMRWASLGSGLLLMGMVWVVRVRAGLTPSRHLPWMRKLIWCVVAYCALGVLANLATPSVWERVVWTPVVSLLLLASLVVAIGP